MFKKTDNIEYLILPRPYINIVSEELRKRRINHNIKKGYDEEQIKEKYDVESDQIASDEIWNEQFEYTDAIEVKVSADELMQFTKESIKKDVMIEIKRRSDEAVEQRKRIAVMTIGLSRLKRQPEKSLIPLPSIIIPQLTIAMDRLKIPHRELTKDEAKRCGEDTTCKLHRRTFKTMVSVIETPLAKDAVLKVLERKSD